MAITLFSFLDPHTWQCNSIVTPIKKWSLLYTPWISPSCVTCFGQHSRMMGCQLPGTSQPPCTLLGLLSALSTSQSCTAGGKCHHMRERLAVPAAVTLDQTSVGQPPDPRLGKWPTWSTQLTTDTQVNLAELNRVSDNKSLLFQVVEVLWCILTEPELTDTRAFFSFFFSCFYIVHKRKTTYRKVK